MKPKAVVFTHVNPKDRDFKTPNTERAFVNKHAERFSAYLKCSNIGLVFVYVSSGVEMLVESMAKYGGAQSSVNLMARSQRCTAIVERALEVAKAGKNFDRPRFKFVDLSKVAPLLKLLWDISPDLIKDLAGWEVQETSSGVTEPQFSYDSPKFFEALIRVVRGVDVRLAPHPIVRIDADVMVNEQAIQTILDEFEEAVRRHDRFFFYSGCYRGTDSRGGSNDDLNSHAVRTTGFFDETGRSAAGDTSLTAANRGFLSDLEPLGAQQLPGGGRSAQVISGAGLVMSLRAILLLPPFMNAGCGIVWIDDHLKRQLHETIGDLSSTDAERLEEARFVQDRHGNRGITERDRDFATGEYLERLLRGCMMDAIVRGDRVRPGPLSSVIKASIKKGRVSLSAAEKSTLRKELRAEARRRGRAVLELWQAKVYSEQDFIDRGFGKWPNPSNLVIQKLVSSTVTAAMNYVDLFFAWRFYVDAFLRLKRADSNWLFTDVPVEFDTATAEGVRDDLQARISDNAVADIWQQEFLDHGQLVEALDTGQTNRDKISPLRQRSRLLGIPRDHSYLYPAFQIDVARRAVYPEVSEVNEILRAAKDPWGVASWWLSTNDRLGAKPADLVGTPRAEELVEAAKAVTAPVG